MSLVVYNVVLETLAKTGKTHTECNRGAGDFSPLKSLVQQESAFSLFLSS